MRIWLREGEYSEIFARVSQLPKDITGILSPASGSLRIQNILLTSSPMKAAELWDQVSRGKLASCSLTTLQLAQGWQKQFDWTKP